jgi:hypothetical protein
MKPNFQSMSKVELRNYGLAHRNDEEAFQFYVDRVAAEEGRVTYPPLPSIDDFENSPELIKTFENDPGRQVS